MFDEFKRRRQRGERRKTVRPDLTAADADSQQTGSKCQMDDL